MIAAAGRVLTDRYPGAATAFVAGSILRGEGTPTSDIDLVVIFLRVDAAWRESFRVPPWPVEAFVHDPGTLEYFFREVDRPSGVPSLMAMVAEGHELPRDSGLGRTLKTLAESVLADGPPRWTRAEVDGSRYALTEMADDLRAPRSADERRAILVRLYPALATHHLRARGRWGATGKAIGRALLASDPAFADRFHRAFAAAFERGETGAVEHLPDEVMAPNGGRLFAGYRRTAPAFWRYPRTESD